MTERWRAQDMADQSARLAVVTGANSGLGRVTARELARAGARVVLACRSAARGQQAMSAISREVPGAQLELELLDLGDLASVRDFARRFSETHDGLDLLINNAGVMATPGGRTADGFERQLGVNHLGHFALTGLLIERLRQRPGARVVTVSSALHRAGKIRFDDLMGERRYRRWRAYSQSKLANLLFAMELERRAVSAGLSLRSVAAHPGYAATNLQSAGPRSPLDRTVMAVANLMFAQSADMGALPTLYAATVSDLPGGSFVGPGGPAESRGHPRLVAAAGAAYDAELAARLWDISEQLTGVALLPVKAHAA